ncbi:MAG: phenylalanine--tRNA ligase subunit beta [Ginsengibacter sp.]
MKISYNWLKDYLPEEALQPSIVDNPKKLGAILTSVGLELESLEKFEEIKNNLDGLIITEVISCEKHPDADKLKVASVNNGLGDTLQIVCGAANIAAGQKVVLAPVGITIYPTKGDPLTLKQAKIRGVESYGMICAEDEIGVGESHAGIIVLPENAIPGTLLSEYYNLYSDWILEIGLTPNRTDAMSHLGVAKDVCAYISHHHKKQVSVVLPFKDNFKKDNNRLPIEVGIENPEACRRYSGVSISGIKVENSPAWLQNKLKSIGLRPVNNVVDITNFILHETGQPLHVFDADKIAGKKIIVKNLPSGTPFTTLDNKQRKLDDQDLMICDGEERPMCFGGVFGGIDSGVTNTTQNVFLESAWFDPSSIRKTSFRHNLRTEAAIRFEKGVDIDSTVKALKRAVLLMKEIAGGNFSSDIIDVYPSPREQTQVILENHYLKRLSGKHYHQDTVKGILKSLNFSIVKEGIDDITVGVPFSNPDVTLPADVIEEIMRIDGLDNIEIPSTIRISPAIETGLFRASMRDRIAGWLTGNGFSEIFTNSITNSKYFDASTLVTTVKIINSLSEDLDVMRPSMIPTGLESIAYNLNRRNSDLLFFEFGKTYYTSALGNYEEHENLALYFTGDKRPLSWGEKSYSIDAYFVKGICQGLLKLAGIPNIEFSTGDNNWLNENFKVKVDDVIIAEGGNILPGEIEKFSIKQPVYYLEVDWQNIMELAQNKDISFIEIPRFPAVNRDLSIIVDKVVSFSSIQQSVMTLQLPKLSEVKLFDVFESDKLGIGKKSLAITFTFLDKEKTLTDTEVDSMMKKISTALEKHNNAEIRNA